MSKHEWIEALVFSGLRLIAVTCLLGGLLNATFGLVDSWHRFDPNYLGTFFSSTILRPLLLLISGCVLYSLAGPWARRMSRQRPGRPS